MMNAKTKSNEEEKYVGGELMGEEIRDDFIDRFDTIVSEANNNELDEFKIRLDRELELAEQVKREKRAEDFQEELLAEFGLDEAMEFMGDHYQNLLSKEENKKNFLDWTNKEKV